MVTITINIENGNDASEACRKVARLIENGYTNGMIGCSGDTFEIEVTSSPMKRKMMSSHHQSLEKPKSELKPWNHIVIHHHTSVTQFIHHTCALQSCLVKIMVLGIKPSMISRLFSM